MTEYDETLFQQLVSNDEVNKMIADLTNLENLVPDDTKMEELEGWELAISFTPEDVPRMVEELEELNDREQ